MKRILSLVMVGLVVLSGCTGAGSQFFSIKNQTSGIAQVDSANAEEELLRGSTQTLTPFIPVVGWVYQSPTYINAQSNVVLVKTTQAGPSSTENAIAETMMNTESVTNTATLKNGLISNLVNTPPTSTIVNTEEPGATATPKGSYIVITGISDTRVGRAFLFFKAVGFYIDSFQVYMSETSPTPGDLTSYPGYGCLKNEGMFISGLPGSTHYYWVCENTESGVDGICSPVVKFTFSNATATPTPTESLIRISGLKPLGSSQIVVSWETIGSYPNGFQIVWSSVNTEPSYPYNQSIYASGSTRSVTVSGTPGVQYYFSVCAYKGNSCDEYSNIAKFVFPSNTITPLPSNTIVVPTKTLNPPTATELPPTDTPIPTDTTYPTETTETTSEGG